MAVAALVIPGAMTVLAQGVTLDATVTTAQTVFASPLAVRALPMYVVFRDASATVNAAATVSAGVTGAATQYLSASTALQSMLTTTGAIWLPVFGSTVATAKAGMQPNTNFIVTFGGTLTSNDKVKCDVIGYLLDTNGGL